MSRTVSVAFVPWPFQSWGVFPVSHCSFLPTGKSSRTASLQSRLAHLFVQNFSCYFCPSPESEIPLCPCTSVGQERVQFPKKENDSVFDVSFLLGLFFLSTRTDNLRRKKGHYLYYCFFPAPPQSLQFPSPLGLLLPRKRTPVELQKTSGLSVTFS